ncbi:hypothetical protein [Micromonospora sp. NBC_01412]|uniref:hypothetical protein n=1 Tax=Micromonospora sp. NBC_01412 TaxID=2903590 RepID=UPI00324BBD75
MTQRAPGRVAGSRALANDHADSLAVADHAGTRPGTTTVSRPGTTTSAAALTIRATADVCQPTGVG